MNSLFSEAINFNSDISKWDVSNVTNMGGLFQAATNFNANISRWDVSNVTNMEYMFEMAESFNQDLSQWNVSNVIDMECMFSGAYKFNADISSWNVSKVDNIFQMFNGAKSFNYDLSSWNLNVRFDKLTIYSAFEGTAIAKFNSRKNTNLATLSLIRKGIPVNARKIILKNGKQGIYSTEKIKGNNWKGAINVIIGRKRTDVDIYQAVEMWFLDKRRAIKEYGDIKDWNTTSVTKMSKLFMNKIHFNEDISGWDVSNVTTMYGMFENATNFNQDISEWDVSNVTDMFGMFEGSPLEDDPPEWYYP